MIKDIYIYFKKITAKYKKNIFLILSLLTISTLLNIGMPFLTKQIIDEGFLKGKIHIVVLYALTIFCLYLADGFIKIANESIRINIEKRIRVDLGEQAFEHLLHLQIKCFENQNYSEIFNNINRDINTIVGIIDKGMLMTLTQILSLVGGLIGLLLVGKELILLVIIFIPLKWACVNKFAHKKEQTVKKCIDLDGGYAKWFGNVMGGIKEIKLFAIKSETKNKFHQYYNKVVDSNGELQKLDEIDASLSVIISQGLIMLIYITGAFLALKQNLSVGSVLAFISFSTLVINPIFTILNIKYEVSGIVPSIKRFESFLQWEEENSEGKTNISDQNIDIEFCDVSFGYNAETQLFNKFNLFIPKGEKIAIIGGNGAGKTTLIEILLRLYKIDNGKIFLGGYDISTLSLDEYRKLFSVVSQEVYLFNGSIEDNIRLNKDYSQDAIISALKECGLEEFAEVDKLKMKVGENGVLLSGGQKQKISLARALMRETPIIIFDEVTSNMDVNSYYFLKKLIQGRLKNNTLICISHESQMINMFDRVIELG